MANDLEEETIIISEQSTIGDYNLRSKLGESALTTIWKAEHRATGEVVALKQIPVAKLTRHLRDCLECELSFLSSVNHPNIIRLLDTFKAEDSIILVLEFCAGGNLASYLRYNGRVQECVAKRFFKQIGSSLKVLNRYCIVHRDLKPEVLSVSPNILLHYYESDPILKIADFGLSRILHPDEFAETVCGSPLYMAPEILQFHKYDGKVDMWSVGVILFELLNGYPPFRGRTNVQLLQNIKASTSLPFAHFMLPQLQPACIDLCSRLLLTNPDCRLSFEEFYQHSFLQM